MLGKSCLVLVAVAVSPAFASGLGDCLTIGSARDAAYLVSNGDDHASCGDMNDPELAAETCADGGDAVWFRLDDQTWVVRDPAVVAQAQVLFAKVNAIGARQGAIGAKQGRIGAEQGQIGIRQAQLALSSLGSSDARSAADARAAEARSARMKELGDRMSVLSKEQSALAGEMKQELDTAQRELSQLLEQAMKDGTAVRVRRL